MTRGICLLLLIASIVMGAVSHANRPVVLLNGHFLTMDAHDSVVTAIGLQSGRIQAVGNKQDVIATMSRLQSRAAWYAGLWGIRYIDLDGQTAIPGFVDAHSHFPASGFVYTGIDLSSPPSGHIENIQTLLQAVTRRAQHQSDARWIVGYNYDDAALSEQRHPTRAELDKAAPDHAVYLRHRSGHMGVGNTRALKELGYDNDADVGGQKAGGSVRELLLRTQGLLQEHAAPGMARLLREIPWWRLPVILFSARDEYLQAGITTVQNGFADKSTLQVLRYAKRLGLIPQRMVVWPAHEKLPMASVLFHRDAKDPVPMPTSGERLAQAIAWPMDDRRKIAIGAIKLIVDGSPQGRTAWLSEPYVHDDSLGHGYRGFANLPEATLHQLILKYHRAGFQLALHGNGDAAIQAIIDGLRAAQGQFPRADARHFIVHAQTIRRQQLRMLAMLDVSVTFFPTHTFYWGDWYRHRVLGESRAALISPLASADELNVRYTTHSDSPVTPIDPMQILWSSTERLTSSGYLLGAGQRVGRLRALRALTIDPAWQNHLDADRGSIEVGKLADIVVLSDNPLTHSDVREISVRQVWIGGKRRLDTEP